MTQSNQYIAGHKPYSFFQDSEIEDWFKKNHTLSYLKFKFKIEPLEERIYKCETLNSEMTEKINELIEDSYFMSKKINDASENSDNIPFWNSALKFLLPITTKLISLFFRSGLSLFPIISIYALIHRLIDGMTNTYSVSITVAVFIGFSFSHFSSGIIQSCLSFYWSELRARNTRQKLLLLFSLIIVLESFVGSYGISYLIGRNRLAFGELALEETVRNQALFLAPTLFSLINMSYSFREEIKQREKLKMIKLRYKRDATDELIRDLRGRIEKNHDELHFYKTTYDEALSGHGGLFDYLDKEKDNTKSLYGSMLKADINEDLTIRVHFDRDSTNSYYELNSHGVTKTFESNNEALKQVSQIINKLIPSQQQANEELHSKLTVYESADILNVSIPYVINLVESGKIPSQREGTQYHIDLNDLLAYKQESDTESHHALAELAREAQELDMGY
jgi:excisionase family DNA binding protein